MNWLVPSFAISQGMSPRFQTVPHISPPPRPTVFTGLCGLKEGGGGGPRPVGREHWAGAESPPSRVTVLTLKVPPPPPRTPSVWGNRDSQLPTRLLPLPEWLGLSLLSSKWEQSWQACLLGPGPHCPHQSCGMQDWQPPASLCLGFLLYEMDVRMFPPRGMLLGSVDLMYINCSALTGTRWWM